eukprot:TRINITY_DN83770_c0_g1_i1.p1 TRINITY_DN83770_c0_g1~~TRINITY_DN83770_c0_g1_i1.p1  ORF type:complete len:186 (+),score=25.66 TRINITY_DN83770_c0_g1_i1:120-677(+)
MASPASATAHQDSIATAKSLGSFAQMSTVMQGLPLHIDPELLRAVPMTTVLEGFGKHWGSNATTAEAWNLSEVVDEMDFFLSHYWGTTRWQKFMALCCLCNERSACIASCCLAVPVEVVGALHGHVHVLVQAKTVCPLIYFVVLLFGQRLVAWFGREVYTSVAASSTSCAFLRLTKRKRQRVSQA